MNTQKFDLTTYSLRHFNPEYTGTIIPMKPEAFIEKVRELAEDAPMVEPATEEYKPFCRHIFLPNFANCKAGIAKITEENRQYLKSDYVARTENELPVLTRWFENMMPPVANYIDLIVYTNKQITEEAAENKSLDVVESEWGIVAINGEMQPYETPPTPATLLRNTLGMASGGNGCPVNAETFSKSVQFWKTHAKIKHFLF